MSNLILPSHFDAGQRAAVFAGAQAANLAAAGSGFDYPATEVGKTPDGLATVYYDPSLGNDGLTLAQAVLAGADAIWNANATYFAPAKPAPGCNIVIAALGGLTNGDGGAYHYGCSFKIGGTLYLDAAFGNPAMVLGLFEAELSECSMGKQSKGWKCGWSNGEALSRLLAELQSGGPSGALAAFATGPAWDQAGRPNWIDATEPTDQNAVSTGCGMIYLYWMISQGHTAAQITQAGCPKAKTLAANYAALTGKSTAWADFSAAVAALPAGAIENDNPFGGTPA